MDVFSRETLEEMMAQAVSRSATFTLWPDGEAPGAKNSDAVFTPEPRHTGTSIFDRAVTGVRSPEITVYAPDKPNGVGLLVTPGGSYRRVVLDKEGSARCAVFAPMRKRGRSTRNASGCWVFLPVRMSPPVWERAAPFWRSGGNASV